MYESKVEMPGQGHQAHLGKFLHFHLILPNIKNDFLSQGSLKHCKICFCLNHKIIFIQVTIHMSSQIRTYFQQMIFYESLTKVSSLPSYQKTDILKSEMISVRQVLN